jgi:hypothetical protein
MPETEAGFNADVAIKELLDLLIKNRVLKRREVEHLLESAKTHFNEVPEEPEIT